MFYGMLNKRGMDAATLQQRVASVLARDQRASARLITQAESGDPAIRPVLQALYRHGGHARVIGITGPPGAGKSTLVDQLVGHYRQQGQRVAVLAVDPSSPLTGGAVLGDRLRMNRHDTDSGVFIRSMATRGVLGGLSKAVGDALTVLDAMGWDVIIVETVGIGQSEMDIVRHTGCIVLLQTALSGDVVQIAKAGILEVGDLFVVNKAEVEGSDRMVNALNEMIGNRGDHGAANTWQHAVVKTEALNGKGIAELAEQIERRFAFLAEHPALARALQITQLRARALEIARDIASRRVASMLDSSEAHADLMLEVLARKCDPYDFAESLLKS
jgi:LAO/AO transport system kinase